jgi:hypothetical protein
MRPIHRVLLTVSPGVLALTLGAAACLAADVVVLRSGTMMEGTVVSLDGDELVLEIEAGKSILDRGDVRSVHFDTTIEELGGGDDAGPGAAPDAPDEGPVFRIGDKKAFGVGDAVETNTLRVRLTGVATERVRIVDIFGNVKDSREEQLVFTFEVRNVGTREVLTVRGNPVFGDKLILLEDQEGDEIKAQSFGAGSRVEGALQDGDEIDPGDRDGHLEVFKVPGGDVERLELRVDLARFGDGGIVRWVVERWE